MPLKVECLTVGPFAENTFLVADAEGGEAILVDPGGETASIQKLASRLGVRVVAIYNTHAHIDHLAGAADAKARFEAPFCLHEGDRDWLEALGEQAQMFGLPAPPAPAVDRWLADGDEIRVGRARGRVVHTPGHSPGGCSFYFAEARMVLTGDTLFAGSIGRTDLPGGSLEVLLASIRERLLPLGDEVVFYPGHGPSGTLGDERRTNPFLGLAT